MPRSDTPRARGLLKAAVTSNGGSSKRTRRKVPPPMTATERQRVFKARMAEAGLVQVNLWLPAGIAPDMAQAAEAIRDNRELTIRLVNRRTGRTVSLKRPGDC